MLTCVILYLILPFYLPVAFASYCSINICHCVQKNFWNNPTVVTAALVGKTADAVNNTNSSVKNTKIVVPLKYLSNICRLLEMPLINRKIHCELNWIEDWILSSAGDSVKLKKQTLNYMFP